jgi:hypothetical protein
MIFDNMTAKKDLGGCDYKVLDLDLSANPHKKL